MWTRLKSWRRPYTATDVRDIVRPAGALLLPALLVLLTLSCVWALCWGTVPIAASEVYGIVASHLGLTGVGGWSDGLDTIVWQVRMPRVLMGALSGAVLSVAGILMQTLTQNPVAEPYVLGISAGASTGAVCAIIYGIFAWMKISWAVPVAAFLGAMGSLALVLSLSGRHPSPLRLILLGMGVSAFFTAMTTFVLNQAQNDSQLRSAMFWMLGSFSSVGWEMLSMTALCLTVTLVFCMFFEKELDALLLGDVTAVSLGVPVIRLKIGAATVAALSTAVVVARIGVVGFVGLIVPHLSRRLCGGRHRILVPTTALAGAVFMVWADAMARTFFRPEELPVGILTCLIGAPLFVWVVCCGYTFGGME